MGYSHLSVTMELESWKNILYKLRNFFQKNAQNFYHLWHQPNLLKIMLLWKQTLLHCYKATCYKEIAPNLPKFAIARNLPNCSKFAKNHGTLKTNFTSLLQSHLSQRNCSKYPLSHPCPVTGLVSTLPAVWLQWWAALPQTPPPVLITRPGRPTFCLYRCAQSRLDEYLTLPDFFLSFFMT